MIADATIARLRSQIKSHVLPSDKLVKAMLILIKWYEDQQRIDQGAPVETDPET